MFPLRCWRTAFSRCSPIQFHCVCTSSHSGSLVWTQCIPGDKWRQRWGLDSGVKMSLVSACSLSHCVSGQQRRGQGRTEEEGPGAAALGLSVWPWPCHFASFPYPRHGLFQLSRGDGPWLPWERGLSWEYSGKWGGPTHSLSSGISNWRWASRELGQCLTGIQGTSSAPGMLPSVSISSHPALREDLM